MKVFTKDGKINFIDDNNVVLGYDLNQGCCESADWFISNKVAPVLKVRSTDNPRLTGWVFDTSYFLGDLKCESLDGGGMAVFRITKDDKEKFIHLYNCQNGYYGHGFDFQVGEDTVQHGVL